MPQPMSFCGWIGAGAGLHWPSGSMPHPIFVTGEVSLRGPRRAQSGSRRWDGIVPKDEATAKARRALRMGMGSPCAAPVAEPPLAHGVRTPLILGAADPSEG